MQPGFGPACRREQQSPSTVAPGYWNSEGTAGVISFPTLQEPTACSALRSQQLTCLLSSGNQKCGPSVPPTGSHTHCCKTMLLKEEGSLKVDWVEKWNEFSFLFSFLSSFPFPPPFFFPSFSPSFPLLSFLLSFFLSWFFFLSCSSTLLLPWGNLYPYLWINRIPPPTPNQGTYTSPALSVCLSGTMTLISCPNFPTDFINLAQAAVPFTL